MMINALALDIAHGTTALRLKAGDMLEEDDAIAATRRRDCESKAEAQTQVRGNDDKAR